MNRKLLIYLLSAFTCLTIIVILAMQNARNLKNLKAEKLLSGTTLAEKNVLKNDLEKAKSDYFSIKQMNDANAAMIKENSAKLAESESAVSRLVKENRSLLTDSRELARVRDLNASLESRIAQLNIEYDRMIRENKDLQARAGRLENEKNELLVQLERASIFRSDNFLATATRGKNSERLVVRAARAKKLNLTFEVPGKLQNLSFKIITPEGKSITQDDQNLSWHYSDEQRNITASLSPVTGEFAESKSVVLNYDVAGKLTKGEYSIMVLTDGKAIGTCRLMVR